MKYFVFMYLIFHLKHMIADFPLQSDFMRLGKLQPSNWLTPLLMHAGVHAICSFVVILSLSIHYGIKFPGTLALVVGAFDFGSHFVIDFFKARFTTQDTSKRMYWWSLGFDQFLHHICNLVIICYVTGWFSVSGMVPA